jgi:hypothetical protein
MVRFDQLEFLDATGEVIRTYRGEWICYGERCELDLVLPQDAHFLRVIAHQIPIRYMEWEDLVENSIRTGVRVNRHGIPIITDDGFGPNGEMDLTKHIANRPWISYFVLEPDVDSDQDGLLNCTKIAEGHYRALDPNPMIPEPKQVKSDVNIGVFYTTGWGIPGGAKRAQDWSIGSSLTPKVGYYESRDPLISSAHIKSMLESGIGIVVPGFAELPTDIGGWEKNLEDGLMRSSYFDEIKFFLMVGPKFEFIDKDSLKSHTEETFSYIVRNYFPLNNYLKINERPVIFFYHAWIYDVFSSHIGLDRERYGLLDVLGQFRGIAKEYGYNNVYIIGDYLTSKTPMSPDQLFKAGHFDALSSYIIKVPTSPHKLHTKAQDYDVVPYEDVIDGYDRVHEFFYNHSKDFHYDIIPSAAPGFSNRLMYELGIDNWLNEWYNSTPERYKKMLTELSEYIHKPPNMILIGPWNEFHEGSVLEETVEYGDAYLKKVRDVFSTEDRW